MQKEFFSILKDCDRSMLENDIYPKNWYMYHVMSDYLAQDTYTVDSIVNTFLLTKRLNREEYFSHFYSNYKKYFKNHKEKQKDLNNLFYGLIDSEVSLRAGCANEFIDGYCSIIKTYYKQLRANLVGKMILRVLTIYAAATPGNVVCRLTEPQLEFLEELDNGGAKLRNVGNGIEDKKEWVIESCKFDLLVDIDYTTVLISDLL